MLYRMGCVCVCVCVCVSVCVCQRVCSLLLASTLAWVSCFHGDTVLGGGFVCFVIFAVCQTGSVSHYDLDLLISLNADILVIF